MYSCVVSIAKLKGNIISFLFNIIFQNMKTTKTAESFKNIDLTNSKSVELLKSFRNDILAVNIPDVRPAMNDINKLTNS